MKKETEKEYNRLLQLIAESKKVHPNYIVNHNNFENSRIKKVIVWFLIKHLGHKHSDFNSNLTYRFFDYIEKSVEECVVKTKEFLINNK